MLSLARSDAVDWRISNGDAKIANPQAAYQIVSYQSPHLTAISLAPSEPIVLPDDVNRLVTWIGNVKGKCSVVFVVTDAENQVHKIASEDSGLEGFRIAWDVKRKGEWPFWTRVESLQFRPPSEEEIRRRLQPVDAEQAIGKIWPRPLRLTGIELVPSAPDAIWGGAFARATIDDIKAGTGEVWLRPVEVESRKSNEAGFYAMLVDRARSYRDKEVTLFPDDLTSAKQGEVEYTIKLQKDYTGPVVWRAAGRVILDREKPISLFDQQISLPRVAKGNYFLEVLSTRPNGKILNRYKFKMLVGESREKEQTALPAVFDFVTNQPDNVYPSETTKADLRLCLNEETLRKAGKNHIKVKICDYTGKTVFEQEVEPSAQISLSVPVEQGKDYFGEAVIGSDDKVFALADVHLGVASNALAKPVGEIPASVPTMHELLDGQAHLNVEYRVAALFSMTYPYLETVNYEDLSLFARQVKDLGSKTISLKAAWPDVEPLPGVYRFGTTDRMMDAVRGSGLGILFSYTPYAGSIWAPRWLKTLPCRTQDGDFQDKEGFVNPLAPEVMDHWLEFWRRLASRYYADPNNFGYRIYNTPLIGGPLPEPFATDYSEAAQQAFDQWMSSRGEKPHPLTPLLSLPGVKVSGLGPDFSPGWRQFVEFNSFTSYETSRRALEALRSVDPKRMIQAERKSHPYAVEQVIPVLAHNGAAMKNEGSPGFREAPLRSMAIQAGVPFVEELHRHIPSSRSITDATNYFATFLGNGTMWLARWIPEHLQENYSQAFLRNLAPTVPFIRETQKNWDEYLVGTFYEPRVLVVGSRTGQLLGGERRGFFADIDGADVYSALFEWQQIPVHFADEFSPWVDFAKFPLVFVSGRILPQVTVDRLIAYTRQGGHLVLVGDAGEIVPEALEAGNILKKSVGALSNVRTIPAPGKLPNANPKSWDAPAAFPEADIDGILQWAGVHRPVQVKANGQPGFQVQMRRNGPHEVTLAIMRNYYGWYRGNIEFEEDLTKKYGSVDGTATVQDLSAGEWTVEKLHRDRRSVGKFMAKDGKLSFPIDRAVAGEVQLFRLRQTSPPSTAGK